MTITVGELIESLEKLPKLLPVYAVQGSSGISVQVGTASLSTVGEWDDGDLLELNEGDEYAHIYTGN